MSATISFTVDTRELSLKLHELAKYARVDPGLVMKDEVKQLSKILIKLTPPSTFAQGRKAVTSDIERVYTTIPSIIKSGEKTGRIEDIAGFKAAVVKAFRKGDDAAMERLMTGPVGAHQVSVKGYTRNGKQVAGYTTKKRGRPVFPQISAGNTKFGGPLNPALHKSRQNARGRVTGNTVSQVVKPGELKDYRDKMRSRVGWHASGWASMAIQSGYAVPSWILKQNLASASGMASLNFGTNPYVRAVNRNVKIPGYQRIVDGAVNNRVRVTAQKLEAVLKGRAVNLGFTRIEKR
jgi:hypothetical protein